MIKKIVLVTLFIFLNLSLTAQEKEADSIIKAEDLTIELTKREKKRVKKDSIKNAKSLDTLTRKEARKLKFFKKSSQKKEIDALAPSRAAFYSAILPGLGQVYNKRYWKVPIVYAALGAGVYYYTWNNTKYNSFRDAYKSRLAGYTNDEYYDLDNSGIVPGTPDFSTDALLDAQNNFQRQRDLALLLTIVGYALNIVDANVDAHLRQFNINDDLSFEPKPVIIQNKINSNTSAGLSLTFKF